MTVAVPRRWLQVWILGGPKRVARWNGLAERPDEVRACPHSSQDDLAARVWRNSLCISAAPSRSVSRGRRPIRLHRPACLQVGNASLMPCDGPSGHGPALEWVHAPRGQVAEGVRAGRAVRLSPRSVADRPRSLVALAARLRSRFREVGGCAAGILWEPEQRQDHLHAVSRCLGRSDGGDLNLTGRPGLRLGNRVAGTQSFPTGHSIR